MDYISVDEIVNIMRGLMIRQGIGLEHLRGVLYKGLLPELPEEKKLLNELNKSRSDEKNKELVDNRIKWAFNGYFGIDERGNSGLFWPDTVKFIVESGELKRDNAEFLLTKFLRKAVLSSVDITNTVNVIADITDGSIDTDELFSFMENKITSSTFFKQNTKLADAIAKIAEKRMNFLSKRQYSWKSTEIIRLVNRTLLLLRNILVADNKKVDAEGRWEDNQFENKYEDFQRRFELISRLASDKDTAPVNTNVAEENRKLIYCLAELLERGIVSDDMMNLLGKEYDIKHIENKKEIEKILNDLYEASTEFENSLNPFRGRKMEKKIRDIFEQETQKLSSQDVTPVVERVKQR